MKATRKSLPPVLKYLPQIRELSDSDGIFRTYSIINELCTDWTEKSTLNI